MKRREDIQIRDPFVYVESGRYYLYGTTDRDCWRAPGGGFEAYVSDDLERFEGPVQVFSPPEGYWGTRNFWAPEMHRYEGSYYLLASFIGPAHRRATSALRADGPLGPFLPFGSRSLTPPDWECLDGTLYVDGQGQPFLVFCHEWVQPGGGSVCAQALEKDLSAPLGRPETLFYARELPWVKRMRHSSGAEGYVTDGPFLYRSPGGPLYLFWSSFSAQGYALSYARSEQGISGPYTHAEQPLIEGGAGHGMVFRDLEGQLRLALHHPNNTPDERPHFLYLQEDASGIRLAGGEVLP